MPRGSKPRPGEAEPAPFHNVQNGPLLSEQVKQPPRRAPSALSQTRAEALEDKVGQIINDAKDNQ